MSADPEEENNDQESDEIDALKQMWRESAPAPGTHTKSSEGGTATSFRDMHLSNPTKESLRLAGMEFPTEIQAAAIPHALAGRDILGAAKTGSGKTLAFVVPLLEKLYAERWDIDDGLAGIIITPTRELALQIFEVIRSAGKKHSFSAGLVTGGKKEFKEEQLRVVRMNILVATPGRLLQHLEQTAGFEASNVQILVLDEADRILDMGFKAQLDGILQYLPRDRQTLLFSATQTKSVKDLARLSLRSPEYLAVHAEDSSVTPLKLHQNYIVCNLQDKLDVLFSFIKSHLKSKIIVFMSTCAQVRFVSECFKGMQPGIPLVALHGKIKQEKRTIVFLDFARRKSAVLFATDIAARGLDFPDVDWVFQLDAPEDTAMYIHRVGRTARYQSGGRALMTLMPTEEKAVVDKLKTAGIDLKKLSINKKQYMSVATQAASLLVSRPECRLLAKKSFIGYLRSLQNLPTTGHQVQPVDLLKLPVDAFSASLGLAFTPPLPVKPSSGSAAGDETKSKKNVNRALDKLKKQIKEAKERKKNARAAAQNDTDDVSDDSNSEDPKRATVNGDDDDDLLVVKQVHNQAVSDDDDNDIPSLTTQETSARAMKRKLSKIRASGASAAVDGGKNQRIKFAEDGTTVEAFGQVEESTDGGVLKDRVRSHMDAVKKRIDAARVDDATAERERVREKHKKNRLLRRDENKEAIGDVQSAVLSNVFEEGSDEGTQSDNSSYYSDDDSIPQTKAVKRSHRDTESDDDDSTEIPSKSV
ncbi:unnamed protein product, partial [Ectocarpus fasciculatus]